MKINIINIDKQYSINSGQPGERKAATVMTSVKYAIKSQEEH